MKYSPMPEQDSFKTMPQPGNANRQPYPDKPEAVRAAQKKNISMVNKNKAKPGYRH